MPKVSELVRKLADHEHQRVDAALENANDLIRHRLWELLNRIFTTDDASVRREVASILTDLNITPHEWLVSDAIWKFKRMAKVTAKSNAQIAAAVKLPRFLQVVSMLSARRNLDPDRLPEEVSASLYDGSTLSPADYIAAMRQALNRAAPLEVGGSFLTNTIEMCGSIADFPWRKGPPLAYSMTDQQANERFYWPPEPIFMVLDRVVEVPGSAVRIKRRSLKEDKSKHDKTTQEVVEERIGLTGFVIDAPMIWAATVGGYSTPEHPGISKGEVKIAGEVYVNPLRTVLTHVMEDGVWNPWSYEFSGPWILSFMMYCVLHLQDRIKTVPARQIDRLVAGMWIPHGLSTKGLPPYRTLDTSDNQRLSELWSRWLNHS